MSTEPFGGPPPSTTEASEEGGPIVARSKKKVRTADMAFAKEDFPPLHPTADTFANSDRKSYRDSVTAESGPKAVQSPLFGMESEDCVDTGFESLTNHHTGITVDNSDPMKPNLILSEDEHRSLCEAFAQTLVVKVVGRSTSLASMKRVLPRLWGKKGKVSVSDVANGFFMVGFGEMADYMLALTGGPWTFAGSYLSVIRWRPDFDPMTEEISKVAVWVRLPGISLKFFDKKFLWHVGSLIGTVLKVDTSTALRARGMFARLCVEIDLSKPLVPHYAINGETKKIEYESLSLLCLSCGRFGHVKGECKETGVAPAAETTDEQPQMGTQNQGINEGPWCVVHKPRRGRRMPGREESMQQASRFAILAQEDEVMGGQNKRNLSNANNENIQRRSTTETRVKRFVIQGGDKQGARRDDQFIFTAGSNNNCGEREAVTNKGKIITRREVETSTEGQLQSLEGISSGHSKGEDSQADTLQNDKMLVELADRNHVEDDGRGTLMIIDKGRTEGLEIERNSECFGC